ncbi:MAG: hypothetical protein KDD69_09275 [Bdellovibrionales bacterium]|nr:hypothetical protein [Bdellovibrionales bacterium]
MSESVPQHPRKASFSSIGRVLLGVLLLAACSAPTESKTNVLSPSALAATAAPPVARNITLDAIALGIPEGSQFNAISVYNLNSCDASSCERMWQVVLPDTGGPTKFVYGGAPTFGAQTIVPAKPLRPGTTYELVVGPSEPRFHFPTQRTRFAITAQGHLVRVRK